MRRFLLMLFLCLIPFSAKATSLSELADFVAAQVTSAVSFVSHSVDESLRPYIDEDDYQTIVDSGAALYYNSFIPYTAMYWPFGHAIQVNSLEFFRNPERTRGIIHHEVQHLKDDQILEKNGYDKDSFTTDLDQVSQMIYGGIIEARAYAEQVAFSYNRKTAFYEEMKKLEEVKEKVKNPDLYLGSIQGEVVFPNTPEYNELKTIIDEAVNLLGEDAWWGSGTVSTENIDSLYEQIKSKYELANEIYSISLTKSAFEKAIKEGKSIKEAKRASAIDFLNDFIFRSTYLPLYESWYYSNGDLHVSPEEFFKIFGEDIFTLEDFYSAEEGWTAICNRKATTNSEECQAFWGRYEAKYCPNLKEKWGNCSHFSEILIADRSCRTFKFKKRIFTNKNDREAYLKCCRKEYAPFHGPEYKEKENPIYP